MKIFTKHPHSVGETYFQHLRFAFTFGYKMIYGGLCCMIHAIFPFFCQTTGSQIALKLAQQFSSRTPISDKKSF